MSIVQKLTDIETYVKEIEESVMDSCPEVDDINDLPGWYVDTITRTTWISSLLKEVKKELADG